MLKSLPGGWADAKSTLSAIERSFAIIEFDPQGKILTANENFCTATGYRLEEIRGRHHSMFVEPDYAKTPEYAAFWNKLAGGMFDAQEYVRIGKDGQEVWLQASYNPVSDISGKVYRWSRSPLSPRMPPSGQQIHRANSRLFPARRP